ncbi:DUF1905 domain-containing protein [Amnibacterium endophyticum]|uniref:DUF1905 domain-containing protein n=1 Tax=Amnibacterium endophyticum TaxID=2109337 RepID=A0ABW4LB19_9MICO
MVELQEDLSLEFTAPLWRWEARRELWTFVSLPAEVTEDVRELAGDVPRGFGAVRVLVTVKTSTWRTSVFPGGEDGRYVLPVKKAVRDANGLDLGTPVAVRLQLQP